VTICTQERENLFGEVINHVGARHASPAYMKLNVYGTIITSVWRQIPKHYYVDLDIFQIMPDHIHFVIYINNHTGEACLAPTNTLGSIIGSFKSECTKQIRTAMNNPKFIVWQRNYYEHIIRDEDDLNRIRYYIEQNPKNWGGTLLRCDEEDVRGRTCLRRQACLRRQDSGDRVTS